MTKGYYRDSDANQSAFRDGWFHTGDIGQVVDGRIQIIDRLKNIVKLAQGEFVAVEQLENIFMKSTFVKQIFIHADRLQCFVLAVVVPNHAAVMRALSYRSPRGSSSATYTEAEKIQLIMRDLRVLASEAQLTSWELPRWLVLEEQLSFSAENHLLTPSHKLNRRALSEHYKARLDPIYAELSDLTETASRQTAQTAQRLRQMIAEVLNSGESSLGKAASAGSSSFVEMGGDSLSAVRILDMVRKEFNVNLPPSVLYESQAIETAASLIGQCQQTGAQTDEFTESTVDFENEARLPEWVHVHGLKAALSWGDQPSSEIFLTGATGFVGVHLLESLLRRTSAVIHCLVRLPLTKHTSATPANLTFAASERLRNVFSKSYSLQCDLEVWRNRVMVHVGSLASEHFGLSESDWQQLAKSVDTIYHCGAHVQTLWNYDRLRAANVVGTLNVLALATSISVKAVHFISTMSVVLPSRDGSLFEEDEPLRHGYLEHAGGYAQSKWVADRLLSQASGRGVPTTILRLGTVSGHRRTGAANPEAFIHRYICGLVQMNAAPHEESVAFMTPVDWVADAIVIISLQRQSLGRTFHLVDPSQRTTMNQVASFVASFGYPLRLGLAYHEWRKELFSASSTSTENALTPLRHYFSGDFPRGMTPVTTKNLRQALTSQSSSEPAIDDVVVIDEPLIHTYLSFFVRTGLLAAPVTATHAALSLASSTILALAVSTAAAQSDENSHAKEGLALRVSTTDIHGLDIRRSGKMALRCSTERDRQSDPDSLEWDDSDRDDAEEEDEQDAEEAEEEEDTQEAGEDDEAASFLEPFISVESLRRSREMILRRSARRSAAARDPTSARAVNRPESVPNTAATTPSLTTSSSSSATPSTVSALLSQPFCLSDVVAKMLEADNNDEEQEPEEGYA